MRRLIGATSSCGITVVICHRARNMCEELLPIHGSFHPQSLPLVGGEYGAYPGGMQDEERAEQCMRGIFSIPSEIVFVNPDCSISISIIVPAYNNPQDLFESLAALKASAWPGSELIVVDDASTDDIASVAGRMGVRVLRLATNSGPAAARKCGSG